MSQREQLTALRGERGRGGAAAPIVLGIAASAAVGGYFNEKSGGNYFSGAIGGTVSGTIQTASSIFGPIGTIIGGGVGSGVGTAITESIDNAFLPKEKRKTKSEVLKDSAISAGVALITNSVTAGVGEMCKDTTIANELMPGGWSEKDSNIFKAFFGVADDASAYKILEGIADERKRQK